MGFRENLKDKKFNKLTVIDFAYNKNGRTYWKCKCDCGNITIVEAYKLKTGHTKACGCLGEYNKKHLYQYSIKHHLMDTRLYRTWQNMKRRCDTPLTDSYKYYGARGIKVCDEWLDKEEGFLNFYNWAMTNGYKDNLTIDRIDVNGNYEPNNCRWVTQSENCRNRNNNVYLTKNGITKTIVEWCEEFNLNQKLVSHRAKIYNNVDEILSKENLLRKKHKSNT